MLLVVVVAIIFVVSSNLEEESSTSGAMEHVLDEQTIISQSQLWKEGDGLKIIVIGRLGTGKSTLIRSLFEENGHTVTIALDHGQRKPIFDMKSPVINNVPFSIMMWNHPKAEHISADKVTNLQKCDLILYVIKMSETRFPPQDSIIMKTLLDKTGPEFISKTVFVLTYANQVGSLDERAIYHKTKEILAKKALAWRSMINKKLNEHLKKEWHPEHFVYAGHPIEPMLYDEHWPSKVLATIFDKLDKSKRPALAKACKMYLLESLQGKYDNKPGGCVI